MGGNSLPDRLQSRSVRRSTAARAPGDALSAARHGRGARRRCASTWTRRRSGRSDPSWAPASISSTRCGAVRSSGRCSAPRSWTRSCRRSRAWTRVCCRPRPRAAGPGAGPAVYQSVLSSAPYADSWRFFQRLNRAGVKIVLGVWGGPAQFTEDGTRRGVLLPSHYDDYVDYVTTVVDFLVRSSTSTLGDDDRQRARRRRRQPDSAGWSGVHRAPAGAAPGGVRRQAVRAGYCRRLDALQYLPPLLDDPVDRRQPGVRRLPPVLPEPQTSAPWWTTCTRATRPAGDRHRVHVVQFRRPRRRPGGQRAERLRVDIANMLLSHYRHGVGRGDVLGRRRLFAARPRRHHPMGRPARARGRLSRERPALLRLQQILPYLQPGARVLEATAGRRRRAETLAVQTAAGAPAVFLVNQEFQPVDLALTLTGEDAGRYPSLVVTATDRTHRAEEARPRGAARRHGPADLVAALGTTLFPAGERLRAPIPERASTVRLAPVRDAQRIQRAVRRHAVGIDQPEDAVEVLWPVGRPRIRQSARARRRAASRIICHSC